MDRSSKQLDPDQTQGLLCLLEQSDLGLHCLLFLLNLWRFFYTFLFYGILENN